MTVCDYAESLINDNYFNDEIEQLPDNCSITYSNIKRFLNYENFVFDDNGKDLIITDTFTLVKEFKELYYLWENYKEFGLPNGKGWINEKPIVLDIIKFFNKCYEHINNFINDKNKMRVNNG